MKGTSTGREWYDIKNLNYWQEMFIYATHGKRCTKT